MIPRNHNSIFLIFKNFMKISLYKNDCEDMNIEKVDTFSLCKSQQNVAIFAKWPNSMCAVQGMLFQYD